MEKTDYRTVTNCRMCDSSEIELFLDLGFTPPADSFLTPEQLNEPETLYPLRVISCRECGFIQLGHIVSAKIMYGENYRYESSTTKYGRDHFRGMAHSIADTFQFKPGSLAVDIGSNVGVLLSAFQEKDYSVLGVDPAPLISSIANVNGIETIEDFFSSALVKRIVPKYGRASVVTATNVFMHIDDVQDVARALDLFLEDDGIFVIEAPYVIDLMQKLEFDTIYLEHMGYLSILPLVLFFRRFGFEVFDAYRTQIHGGSMRVFVGHAGGHPVKRSILEFLELEKNEQLYSIDRLKKFSSDVVRLRSRFFSMLYELKRTGKKIVGLSAPAKSTTFLNYSKIDSSLLDYITEKAQLKVGLFSPGMHIPIYDDQNIMDEMPDYVVILAWNFADEIMKNMDEYRKRGGKFIIPIPEPRVV